MATRPRFHFTPARNWMNDPNGLIRYDGEWHLFFQYNPHGDRWGSISWGHAVSTDLARWTELPVALPGTADEMVFSGCVVAEGDRLVAVYTVFRTADRRQVQALAYSGDRGRTWTPYEGNPVLRHDDPDFRDPRVVRHGDDWVMAVALSAQRRIAFYRSADLVRWTPLSTFGPGPAGELWETPDLFPLEVDGRVRWVLSVGVDRRPAGDTGTRWYAGDFDGTRFSATDSGPADHGPDFYAAASFAGVPDRRIWLAWMNNWRYADTIPAAPWRGAMTVPREVCLRTVDGHLRLVQRPALDLVPTTGPGAAGAGAGAAGAGAGGGPDAVLVEAEVPPGSEVGLDLPGGTRVGWRDGRLELRRGGPFPGRYAGPLPARDGDVRFLVVLDAGSVEVFGGTGETVLTALVPEGPDGAGPSPYATGGARPRLTALALGPAPSLSRSG